MDPIKKKSNDSSPRIGFIGAGRVAKGLAWGMAQGGQRVAAVASRSPRSAQQLAAGIAGCRAADDAQDVVDDCDLIFVTVPDDAIAAVAAGLRWRREVSVIHCSGATELAALAPAARAGAKIGGFHPLQLFADPEVALAGLPGCTISIEAEAPLLQQLELLGQALHCRTIRLPPGCRARYHAAAHYAAGFVITLLNEAVQLWQSFGIEREDTIRALLPLLRGTAASVERSGLAQGLAGTYSRGDLGTLEKHLADLGGVSADALHLYCELALRSIPLGLERGGYDEHRAELMRTLLRRALNS
ncbi:MAG: DUF2520 domain-containing protein [Burkholderiales bacterium]|nr:DUF2520 domain-containing protein [Burkholderiales bacterium]